MLLFILILRNNYSKKQNTKILVTFSFANFANYTLPNKSKGNLFPQKSNEQ